jgi:tRNA pseudouridine55 synthase
LKEDGSESMVVNGIIIINKPSGISSHRVVEMIRKIFPGIKVGHSGTLDPMAEGVLPICLGKATRVAEYITELPKTYRAGIVLGITTDTEDATGEIIQTKTIPSLYTEDVEAILKKFTGKIEQLAPLYSAVKHKGKPFYYWTRQGVEVPPRVRTAHIYWIKLINFNLQNKPHLVLEIGCSKGTYIRTLAADIGKAIGCGAHLSDLTRTVVGPYSIEGAYKVEEIADLAGPNSYQPFLHNTDSALQHYPRITLPDTLIAALKKGQVVDIDDKDLLNSLSDSKLITIYDQQGRFKVLGGLAELENRKGLKTIKYLGDS